MSMEFNNRHKRINHTTGEVQINYAFLDKPDKPKDPKIAPAYGCKIAFDKADEGEMAQFAAFQKDVAAVVKSAFPNITKEEFAKLRMPWKDGDTDYATAKGSFADMVRGCMVVEPKLKQQYEVTEDRKDENGETIKIKVVKTRPPIPCFESARGPDGKVQKRPASEIVSGNIVRVCIRLSAYDGFGGGVSAQLEAVQYRGEGNAFTGTAAFDPEAAFAEDTPVIKAGSDVGSDLESLM